MSNIPSELKYTQNHTWVRLEDDGVVTVGITDHGQALLGEIVFIELPEPDIEIEASTEAGVVESVKAAVDIESPLSGTIIDVNETILSKTTIINQDPYEQGWLFKLQPVDEDDLDELLDADEYAEQVTNIEH